MPSSRYDVANPRIDQIGPMRRLEPDAPLVAAYLGGRPVILARPEQRGQAYPDQETLPISVSRLRRAIDIEADRATGPFVPSLVDDFPLSHMPMVYELSGEEQDPTAGRFGRHVLAAVVAGASFAAVGAAIAPPGERIEGAAMFGFSAVGALALGVAVLAWRGSP